jgi:hypothetical protein
MDVYAEGVRKVWETRRQAWPAISEDANYARIDHDHPFAGMTTPH